MSIVSKLIKKNMKKLIILLALISFSNLFSQGDNFIRSSLNMILIEDFGFDNGDAVQEAYKNYTFPLGVYNNHNINLKSLFLSDYNLSEEEEEFYGVNKTEVGNILGDAVTETSDGTAISAAAGYFLNDSWFTFAELGLTDDTPDGLDIGLGKRYMISDNVELNPGLSYNTDMEAIGLVIGFAIKL